MPIYSLSNNFSPTLFDSPVCNCYRCFNDGFRALESFLVDYIDTKRFDMDLADDVRRDFLTSIILLGDDDRTLVEFRNVFMQYAMISALLCETTLMARLFESRQVDRRALSEEDALFYSALAKAASRQGDVVMIDENEVVGIGNLAMFAAMSKGIANCTSRDFLRLSPNDFLLRYILCVAPEGSPLLERLGSFSWLNLPEDELLQRSELFADALSDAEGELDVGKRYVLKCLLNSYKDYALDDETETFFRLGYKHYDQMYDDTTRILDAKAKEFEMYTNYGAARDNLPATWHFRRFHTLNSEFIPAAFAKNSFCKREIDILIKMEAESEDPGFLTCLLDQIYFFNPSNEYPDTRVIKFIFNAYPRVIYADFAQFADNVTNYFWLPEMPVKVLNADDTEFYMASQIKKLRKGAAALKFGMIHGALALEEPFRGLFMHAYGMRFIELTPEADFFSDNPAFMEFVLYLRNLSREMCRKSALHILKHAAGKDFVEAALNQLLFIAPDMETLRLVIAQTLDFGAHALTLLERLNLPPDELLAHLKERDFDRLVTTLINRESGGIFFHPSIAHILDKMLRLGKLSGGDHALYLSAAYLSHNFRPSENMLAPGLLPKESLTQGALEGLQPEVRIRFFAMFLSAKLDNRAFDDEFFDAFERLWAISGTQDGNGGGGGRESRDEACALIWRMLSECDAPYFARFLPYVQRINIGQNDSSILREFIIYRKIQSGEVITRDEVELMHKLYQTQGIVTPRTKTVVDAIGADQVMAEHLIAFDWIKADPTWTNITVAAADYADFLDDFTKSEDSRGADKYTYVFRVGYVNVYTLMYTANGERHTRLVRRELTTWDRDLIFRRAYDCINGNPGADLNFLLLAGRLCVDANIFDLDILFEYIAYAANRRDMRTEALKALTYVLTNQNALTKACIYAPGLSFDSARLKRFFTTCFTFWTDLKKTVPLRPFFAYIRSLEHIAGKSKLGNLTDHLHEQILHNPQVKPDLSEEYRVEFLERY